jgi:uncharacterized protein
MAEFKEHRPGTFCYVELVTTDPDAAGNFYGSLFGWKRNDQDMGEHGLYTQFTLRDKISAAMHKLTADQAAQNVPPHWGLYITVNDVDAASAKVGELGGQLLMGPMDVMDAGRMSVIMDPQGATICLWQANVHCGVQVRDEVDALCWGELMTTDTDAATNFYGGLLGWEPHMSETEGMRNYTSFIAGSTPAAGMMAITPEMGPIPPNWLAYFQVADCASAETKATGLGGTALVPTTEIPQTGKFTVIQDPQGVVFGLYEPLSK